MTKLNAYGDSIANGYGVSNSFSAIFAQRMGWDFTNYAINGARASDIADSVYSSAISSTTKSVLAIGENNLNNDLTGVASATFKLEHFALAARLAIPDSAKVFANSSAIAYAVPSGPAWAADSALSGPGGATGLMYTATLGATITFQFSGDVLYLGYTMSNAGGGKSSVKVDGVVHPRQVDSNSYGAVSSGATPPRVYSPAIWRADGFGPGLHTCIITVLDTNYFRFNYFCTPVSGPEVFVGTITRVTTASLQPKYNDYNNAVKSNVALLQADGLSVHLVDAANVVNQYNGLIDGLHPNQITHFKMANEDIVAAGGAPILIYTPIALYLGSDGNIYAGNDYDKYLIKTGPL